jgi:hypothetical protein
VTKFGFAKSFGAAPRCWASSSFSRPAHCLYIDDDEAGASISAVRVLVAVLPQVSVTMVSVVACDVSTRMLPDNTVDEGSVGQIVALVIVHYCARVGVGVADIDSS